MGRNSVCPAGGLEMEAFRRKQEQISAETEAHELRAEPEADLEVAPLVVERAFAGIWIGDREIKRVAYQELFASTVADMSSNWMHLVEPRGFEPLTF
jgi:hypothetical protein